jgi:hypothetical protein
MKIKYNNLSILAVILLLGSSGCSKNFLDTKIDTYATPATIITDRSTLYTFADEFYTSLPYGYNTLDGNLFAAASDEAQQTVSGGNALYFNQGVLSPTITPDLQYKPLYEGIRAANFYLTYSQGWRAFLAMNRDTVADVTNYDKDLLFIPWFRAEAHIARAFYYFELSKRYGGVPLITQTQDQSASEYIAKSSYDSITNFIVSEIDSYKDSLQLNWETSPYADQDGRFSTGSALALKSRVLLYAASPLHNPSNDVTKWQLAAAAARDVITTAGLNYSLYMGGYGNYFIGSNSLTSNETIFAVRQPAGNGPETANYPIATPGGHSGLAPTHNLVADYEYTGAADPTNPYANRDPRLAASIVTNGSVWNGRTIVESLGGSDDMTMSNTSKTGYYLKKFLTDNLNLVNGGTAQHNWVIFRYAEMLLNYAEAMNEAYGPDVAPTGYPLTARQALKQVRDRASTSLPAVTAGSVTDFRTAVKHERRIELAFEDHRYWDLLRWKDAGTVLNQPIQGVTVTQNPDGTYNYSVVNSVTTRTFNAPAMYYYPFPQTEIVNAHGALVQNPGY